MVERPHTGPLPPLHPVQDGRLPMPDGQGVPQPPLPPRELRRARLLFVLAAAVVVAGVIVGALQ